MAGYIFTVKKHKNESAVDAIGNIVRKGIYSTNLKIENNYWGPAHEGTFSDYLSMKPGDNVYFFSDRNLYGIGILKNILDDCKLLNYPNADMPELNADDFKKNILEDQANRIICTFEENPHFFKKGVDMDKVLSSNPAAFKMLRAMWKLSFIKIDDHENQALFDIILKENEENLADSNTHMQMENKYHQKLLQQTSKKDYIFNSKNILKLSSSGDTIKHEMALEAGIIDYISSTQGEIFGSWDYISHQVVASPFKPIDYMDKMDIFGYRRISGYETISKYLVIEIKKDDADTSVLSQVMKYVDWINQEYSFGDYGMITAFVVAKDFPQEVISEKDAIGNRTYIKGIRPVESAEWKDLTLVKYSYNELTGELEFTII
ncbi:hypothetical protein [Trichococcus shcherbakoviae]|nr:hypothetical protein [Trichococcus shcherbakoviae]